MCRGSSCIDNEAGAADGDGGASKPCYYASSEVAAEMRELAKNAVPLMGAGLLLYPRGLISMYFLGRLGSLELAGGSLAIAFANITGYSVLYGLSLGVEPICGQAYGAGQRRLMAVAARRAAALLLMATLPIAVVWFHIGRLLLLLRQDPGVAAIAHTYLLHSLPDLPLLCLLHPLRIFLRSHSLTTPLFISAAAALPLHFLATSFLARIGAAAGVALASVCTNAYLLLLLLIYVRFFFPKQKAGNGGGTVQLSPPLPNSSAVDWTPIVRLALPSCVLVCLEWWWYELMILIAGLLPDARSAVAAMGILIQITAFLYIFPSSLGLAVSTRVSNELGGNRPERARLAVVVAGACAVGMGLAAMALAASIRQSWGRIFTEEEGVLRLVAGALPIIGLCEVGNSPQTAAGGVLRGSARPSMGVIINLTSFYAVGLPVSVFLVFWAHVGFLGIWLGLLAAQISCAISMFLVVVRTNWSLQAQRSQTLVSRPNTKNPNKTLTLVCCPPSAKDDDDHHGFISIPLSTSSEIPLSTTSFEIPLSTTFEIPLPISSKVDNDHHPSMSLHPRLDLDLDAYASTYEKASRGIIDEEEALPLISKPLLP